jgi:hypothetical protein
MREEYNMQKKLLGLLVCFLFLTPVLTVSATADSEAKLDIQIFGGFPLPILIKYAGGVITNIGDITAYNISYKLTIIGGTSGNINISYEGIHDDLEPLKTSGSALGVMTPDVNGFGPITITFTASATNAEDITVKSKGFQIGDITWIPLSWIIPRLLRGIIPWLEFE